MHLPYILLAFAAQQAIATPLDVDLMPRQDSGIVGTSSPRLIEPGFHISNGYLWELWFDGWNLCPKYNPGELIAPYRSFITETAEVYWDKLGNATSAERVMAALQNWWQARVSARHPRSPQV